MAALSFKGVSTVVTLRFRAISCTRLYSPQILGSQFFQFRDTHAVAYSCSLPLRIWFYWLLSLCAISALFTLKQLRDRSCFSSEIARALYTGVCMRKTLSPSFLAEG